MIATNEDGTSVGVVVQRLSQVGRLSLTHVQIDGYAGSGHSRSQRVESNFLNPVAELMACQSALA
jgi:hypothetical protein